jgi:hypothetical protein
LIPLLSVRVSDCIGCDEGVTQKKRDAKQLDDGIGDSSVSVDAASGFR